MVSVCFYFQVHQPYRLRNYSVFDIGKSHDYFDEARNRKEILKISEKCYLPANKMLLEHIKKSNLRVSFSFSGVVLEQFEQIRPEVLDSFAELIDTGAVEVLDETYYHSLAFIYSKKEFRRQTLLHRKKMRELFGVTPRVFRNTELIYNNELAALASDMGYKGILAEGADHVLGWRSPNFVYTAKDSDISLLLKNYRLSDDIAFRFSDRGWSEWPLTAEKFASWVNATNGNGNVVNLFMDYETFGEHQWADTGIFNFMKHLPKEVQKNPDNDFKTPSEVIRDYSPVAELDMPNLVSWADIERDLSAWTGNKMQQAAIRQINIVEKEILRTRNRKLIEDWRKLQISDHFYYMCTKWFSDGDVHKYFNPYDSPYEAFISFMNVANDLRMRARKEVIAYG